MVYNEAEFLGIPWETLIKTFRTELDGTPFGNVKAYADRFIDFLSTNKMFTENLQADHYASTVLHRFNQMLIEAKSLTHLRRDAGQKVKLKNIIEEVIKDRLTKWRSKDDLPGMGPEFGKEVADKYKDSIQDAIKAIFEPYKLGEEALSQLNEIASYFPYKCAVIDGAYSGVVVAGFGENEVWPSLFEIIVDGVTLDKLKFYSGRNNIISNSSASGITPFAQSDVVVSFIEGADPAYGYFTDTYIVELLNKYHQRLNVTPEEAEKVINDLREGLKSYRLEKHVNPILSAVEALPKDELATFAESLVYLTSMKRRYSFDYETVGGPIDVAVISKGDGFVWIKRKHYFKPEMNPQFFSNKYGSSFPNRRGGKHHGNKANDINNEKGGEFEST